MTIKHQQRTERVVTVLSGLMRKCDGTLEVVQVA